MSYSYRWMWSLLILGLAVWGGSVLVDGIKNRVGGNYDEVVRAAGIKHNETASVRFALSDGSPVEIQCHPTGEKDYVNITLDQLKEHLASFYDEKVASVTAAFVGKTCAVFVSTAQLFIIDIFVASGDASTTGAEINIAPRIRDDRTSATAEAPGQPKIVLTSYEKHDRPILLGRIYHPFWSFIKIDYNIEPESFKALMVSTLQESARLSDAKLDDFGTNRIAQQIVQHIRETTGLFEIRKNWVVMLTTGVFQSMVLFVFATALFLTAQAFLVALLQLLPTVRARPGWTAIASDLGATVSLLASNLAGTLTYFGLLGTMLGIFLAVDDLSAIDFVDEMRKVFDQTRSFGSMSLALGSSVLGLGGSLGLWILQATLNFVLGRRFFET